MTGFAGRDRDDGPIRPLTDRQRQIAELIVRGKSYREIGELLVPRITAGTVRNAVREMALLFPNDEDLAPRMTIYVWMREREWERRRQPAPAYGAA